MRAGEPAEKDAAEQPVESFVSITNFDLADPVHTGAAGGDGVFAPYLVLGDADDQYAGVLVDAGNGQGIADVRDDIYGQTSPDEWNWDWGPGNADALAASLEYTGQEIDTVTLAMPEPRAPGDYTAQSDKFAGCVSGPDGDTVVRGADAVLAGLISNADMQIPQSATVPLDALAQGSPIEVLPEDLRLPAVDEVDYTPREADLGAESVSFTYTGGDTGGLAGGRGEFSTLRSKAKAGETKYLQFFETPNDTEVAIPIAPAAQSERARKAYRHEARQNADAYTDGGEIHASTLSWVDMIWSPDQDIDDIAYITALEERGNVAQDDLSLDNAPAMADPTEGYFRIGEGTYRVNSETIQEIPWRTGDTLIVTENGYETPVDRTFQ